MLKYFNLFILLFSGFVSKCSSEFTTPELTTTLKSFMFWPNATVPFYIDPDHFDSEQVTAILKSLAMFAFKTCIKFAPVMAAPSLGQHVMTFINPEGMRRCRIEIKGHSNFDPHIVKIGYECLHTSNLDMIIARALGLPFEHTRLTRDIYIDVFIENIEPDFIQLFAKESILPAILRSLPYDPDSIMHFGERDYSKNGHRTIRFKNRSFRQNKNGLTATDIKKIGFIYEPECRTRDRAEKIAMCQSYPGIGRRKREIVEPLANMSLRVNPNITPPPHIVAGLPEDPNADKPQEILKNTEETAGSENNIDSLGIANETEIILKLVHQLSALALKHAREKYCNVTSNSTSEFEFHYEKAKDETKASDVLSIHKVIVDFAKSIVADVASNLTEFCQNSETVEAYQSQCKLENDARCPKAYRSSKSEVVKLSNKHKLVDKEPDNVNDKMKIDEEVPTTLKAKRRKREANDTVTTPKPTEEIKDKKATKETEIKNDEKNLKEKVQAMKKELLKEIKADNSTKSDAVSSTTDSQVKDDKKEPTRRKFREKRYKVKKFRDNSDWEESDTSLDKQIEPGKTLSNTALLEKVLSLGAGSVFETKKTKKKSVEVEKSVEKEHKSGESSADSANTSEDRESTDEKGQKAVTKTRKGYKTADESSSRSAEETEEKPKKRNSHKTKRTQKRGGALPKTVELTKLNKEFYSERKWPDGAVIYVIAHLPGYDLDDLRSRLAAVNSILTEKTCVKLREVDAKEAPGFDDYMILDDSPDYVTGRVGGKQNFGTIELFEGGYHKQHTAMMVMAMLGFYFEVSRHDRDKHIRVHNRHIRADKLHHFEKIRDEATLDLPYDFKSATHPAWQFWRRPGKRGISTVATYKAQDPDGSIMRALGQNPELLSATDIIKINSVYGVECFQSNRAPHKTELRMLEKDEEVIQ